MHIAEGFLRLRKEYEIKMINTVFGQLSFNVGWMASTNILYFGRECFIDLKVKAYFEEDGITDRQEKAYLDYTQNKKAKFAVIECLLNNYADNASVRFVPRTLLFERDGAYALICDDKYEPDGGIAVCLAPVEEVIELDDYL